MKLGCPHVLYCKKTNLNQRKQYHRQFSGSPNCLSHLIDSHKIIRRQTNKLLDAYATLSLKKSLYLGELLCVHQVYDAMQILRYLQDGYLVVAAEVVVDHPIIRANLPPEIQPQCRLTIADQLHQ